MKKPVCFTYVLTFLTGFLLTFVAQAQVISPLGTEVNFSYTTTFEVPTNAFEATDEDRAVFHAQHMFGIMHSPTLIRKYGIHSETDGGIGAPRSQMKIKILKSETRDNKIVITYSNSGKMLLNKKAAEPILADGFLQMPLPTNPYDIYDVNCTDAHYTTFGDYWYFYDPYRVGCRKLSKPPLATPIQIKIEPYAAKKLDQTPKLPYLRGDNGNGSLFSIYVVHGYSEGAKVKDDDGKLNFEQFDDYLREQGFDESREPSGSKVPLHVFKKQIQLTNGKTIDVEIKHMLVATEMESRSTAFAKFFKQAVENADVILYGGHSGLGGNLDIPSLEEKAGKYKFNPAKKQLFFFDSCSSYSYYLEQFAATKTKAKIDIITNGLSSYFYTSNDVFVALMTHLLSEDAGDQNWSDILGDMEKVLGADSYLVNVGGI